MDPTLIKIAIKVMMRMKKMVWAVSVRLAVSNERLLLWKKHTTKVLLKPLVLLEQHINYIDLKLLSTACEVVQDGDKWDDGDCTLNLTDGFMIQLLKPNILRNKGFNNL